MQAAATLDSPPQTETATRWSAVRIVLLILAIVQTLSELLNVPMLLADLSEIPGRSFGGLIITAVPAISPFVAIAALVFALKGRIGHAIVAIAVIGLLDWLNYVPSLTVQDLVPNASFKSILTLVQTLVLPTICVAAIRLVWRNERFGLATLMAAMPTLLLVVLVIGFAISLSMKGV